MINCKGKRTVGIANKRNKCQKNDNRLKKLRITMKKRVKKKKIKGKLHRTAKAQGKCSGL